MSQKTLEEAAKDYAITIGNLNGTSEFDFIRGAKWQQDRMYNEEEVLEAMKWARTFSSKMNDVDFIKLFKKQ